MLNRIVYRKNDKSHEQISDQCFGTVLIDMEVLGK